MAIDPEIQAAINAIDRKIAKLQQVKNLLLSEFPSAPESVASVSVGVPDVIKTEHGTITFQGQAPTITTQPQASTRKLQVAEFLLEQGAKRRREIVENTGIPEGTVSYVLNDSDTFAHDSHTGKWRLTDQAREALMEEKMTTAGERVLVGQR
jgi:hypothetical protein